MHPDLKKAILKAVLSCLIAILLAVGAFYGLTSCRATRTITTEAKCIQKGDTAVTIQTKTIEKYEGVKR